MKILATPGAVKYVRAHGGVVHVWAMAMEYGYRPVFVLEASTEPPSTEHRFARFEGEGIELLLDADDHGTPDSLHLDVAGVFRKRIRATWNGNMFTPG